MESVTTVRCVNSAVLREGLGARIHERTVVFSNEGSLGAGTNRDAAPGAP